MRVVKAEMENERNRLIYRELIESASNELPKQFKAFDLEKLIKQKYPKQALGYSRLVRAEGVRAHLPMGEFRVLQNSDTRLSVTFEKL